MRGTLDKSAKKWYVTPLKLGKFVLFFFVWGVLNAREVVVRKKIAVNVGLVMLVTSYLIYAMFTPSYDSLRRNGKR